GNFQKDNFGRGGEDNDAVIANAQDGAGVNNARFFPAPDGYAGRIEMFVFDGPDPDRDGDFDAEIILHEYTHGLTDRMVAGGVGIYQLVTAGLAEGWSDFYALSLLNDGSNLDATYTEGAYATYQLFGLTQNYYYGIRRYPYTTDMSKNPLTFKDIDPTQLSSYPNVPRSPIHPFNPGGANEPHRMGELWCVTLLEARANLIRKHGFPAGNELTLQLVTDALKYSPPNPTFLQARDAIFQADRLLTGGANQSELWAAFAKRGMGLGAIDGPNWTTEGIREAFDRPDTLTVIPAGIVRFSGAAGGPIDPECQVLTIANGSPEAVAWELSNPEPNFTLSSSGGTLAPGQNALVRVCPTSSAFGLGVGAYTLPLYITNASSHVVQRRDLSIQVLQVARMPFSEDFERETLAPYWTLSGLGLARTLLLSDRGPYAGAQHLTFSTGANGIYARNEATIAMDLAGYTNVVLRFWAKEFNDKADGPPSAPFLESADFDGVAISADGYRWYEAAGLRRLRADYSEVVVPLDDTLARYGLGYNGQFRIRFNQVGNAPIPDAGIAIDNISITGSAPKRLVVVLPEIVQEGTGTISGRAAVQLPTAPAQDVTVQLSSSKPQTVAVPQTVMLRAGATSAAFDLEVREDDVLNGEDTAVITATASGHFPGDATLRIADNETAMLTLSVATQLIEGRGQLSGAGRVSLSRAPARDLLVQLASSDPAVAAVPAGVVVPAGQTSAIFTIFVGDDGALDGPQTVTLSARATEVIQAAINVAVLDDETTNLFVSLPPVLNESSTTLGSIGSVRIAGTVPTNVTVSLTSNHTNKLRVPALVIIPAGKISATFNVTLLDDAVGEAATNVGVAAIADGFAPGSTVVRILDNDVAPLAYNPRPAPGSSTSARGVQLAWDLGTPELIVNGDFETGNFSGWVKENTGSGDFVINSGSLDPPGPEGRSPAYAGRYSALSQQSSPGQRTIYQDVAIPAFFDSAILNWTHRIRNPAGEFSDSHFFRVEIRGLDNSLLAIAFSTRPGDQTLTDWQEHTFGLQNFRGITIRIAFVESDSLGFLNVGLDNVRIFLNSPGTVTSEVYLGTTSNLGLPQFQGATTNTFWDLPPLGLDSHHYWQIVTRRGDARVVNPVWPFQTRGLGPLDHFVWNPVASNQVMNRPFPAGLRATDADGNVISNFSRSVSLSATMPQATEPVPVLTFTGFRLTSREYRRTLAAISIYFTNYVETFFTATDPAALQAQLAGKKVFLVIEQDAAPVERMAALGKEWAPVLRPFVANGGVVIVCSYIRDEHEILNSGDLMQLTKVSPYPSGALTVAAAHALTEGVTPDFTGANLSSYTSDNGVSVVTLAGTTNGVVLTRPYGAGHVVMIGTDYSVNRTGLDRVVANAVKLAEGSTSSELRVAPPFTGYFVNGAWAGNVAVLAAGSNIVLTANDEQGHTGRSIPLTVVGFNDLSVTLVDTPDPVTLGSNIVYTARVRNSGPAPATGVRLTFDVPSTLDILATSSSQGSCTVGTDNVICEMGTLLSNGIAQVRIDASPHAAGTVQLTVTTSADDEDSYPDNDSATAFTGVGYPSIFISGKSVTEGNSGSTTVTFPLQLRPPSSKTVSVRYASSNITATAGSDYAPQTGTIIFAPGQTNQAVSFTIFGDTLYEGNESFVVHLFGATNAILGEVDAYGAIIEDDPSPALSILDAVVIEGGDGSTTQAVFTVQLSTNAGIAVTAEYSTFAGTASPVLDFVPAIGSVIIPAGTTATSVVVTVKGDRISETNETFFVKLSNVANASLARGQATGTILDDDLGELARFAWNAIPAEQKYGVPFPVTITARDALGNTAAGFTGPVSLAGWADARQSSVGPSDQPLEYPMGAYFHDQRVQALYTAAEVGEATRITGLALLVQTPPGQTLE
ncbi:MAG TPA: M36 family metallopeptidase, partial [Verrucomicrobiae bacterium]|nr:M36 family metallopeptidase [Verrucomicrobiae bacterium]